MVAMQGAHHEWSTTALWGSGNKSRLLGASRQWAINTLGTLHFE